MNVSYTEDITVASVLLVDKIQTLYDSVTGKGAMTEEDLLKHPLLRLKVDKVQLLDRFAARQPVFGTLYITTTHLIFVAESGNQETWILHSHVGTVERGPLSVSGCPLNIRCKTFRLLSFVIQRDKECQDVYETLLQLSRPVNIEDVYAFSYVPASRSLLKTEGWDYYDIMEDYMRMGIPNDYWVVSEFNINYTHCDTYPQRLVVPKSVPKQVLIGSSKFRSRGRLPVLSYFLESTKGGICRCSQPLAGFSARCVEDEDMMQHILKANPNCNLLYVVDTRPKINAMVNKVSGKGFEDAKNYANIRFHFFEIENIHVMRGSLQKMVEVVSQSNLTVSGFLGGLESSGWLRHVKLVLEAGAFLADSVLRGISCVVHCSDGWDRTSQTISVASILIDPHYRTLRGFQTLIEKDWLAFGHKFSDRCGHAGGGGNAPQGSPAPENTGNVTNSSSGKEVSPIFTQFLDCVWQLMNQYPRGFQFNETFLIDLHDDVTSCQFGTFLGNCDKDRRDLRLSERTYSLWGYMEKRRDTYTNPLYQPDQRKPWKPDLRPQAIKFWRGMYNRFEDGVHARESLMDLGGMLKDHVEVLKDHLSLLQKRVTELGVGLGKVPKSPTSTSYSPTVMIDSGHSSTILDPPPALSLPPTDPINSLKVQSDSESGVDDQTALSSSDASSNSKPNSVSRPPNLLHAGMSQSLTSLDMSFTDVCSSEVASVAVRWESLRKGRSCNTCGKSFLHSDRKCHCYKCGLVFCRRCLEAQVQLPGLTTKMSCPVCRQCYQDLYPTSPTTTAS